MRFQYDPITDCSVKSNDRFEFFDKIDLNDFLKKTKETEAEQFSCNYTLHAVRNLYKQK
jgi:ubiquitin carboxyl-terminal hydrolase 7